MNQILFALVFQEEAATDSSMWIIIAGVLVVLFFIVVIIGVGLTIFFIARKRNREQKAGAGAAGLATGAAPAYTPIPQESSMPSPAPEAAFENAPAAALEPEPAMASDAPENMETMDFDPTRTVAIIREPAVVSYGTIKFVSGVSAGQEFQVNADGAFIGRDESLSQIVVSDPRISKRHLWIGVRDGAVTIVDQDSRNGTFLNDPKTERITEAKLNSGDTVIMGESDVARFEYLS